MKNLRHLLLAGLSVILVAQVAGPQPAQAQVTPQGGKYLLRIKWQKGKVYSYTISNKMGAGSGSKGGSFTTGYSLNVLDVVNGVATVKVTAEKMPGSQSAPAPTTLKIDSKGHQVGGAAMSQSNSVGLQPLPDKPIGIGESWAGSINTNSQVGKVTVKTVDVLKSVRKVGSRSVAEIAVSTAMTGNGMSSKGSGTMLVDASDGMLISMSQNMAMTINQGKKPMNLNTSLTITRK